MGLKMQWHFQNGIVFYCPRMLSRRNSAIKEDELKKKKKLHSLSLRANYTDRATAA
jgi:hypothetical protein